MPPAPVEDYEIHGNTIPHLHVHLLPRGPGDGYGEAGLMRTPEELEALRAAFAPDGDFTLAL